MFVAVVNRNSDASYSAIQERLLRWQDDGERLASVPFDDSKVEVAGAVTLMQQRRWNTAESKLERSIICDHASGAKILSWSRIDNRSELLELLSPSFSELTCTDSGLILACYLHFGDGFCEKLIGDFSFIILDANNNTLHAARDHLGVRPLYYYLDSELLIVASSIAIITALPGIDLTHSEEWMARYIAGCSADWELCAYEKIKKVPPAHTLRSGLSSRLGAPSLHRYFEFSAESVRSFSSEQEYIDAYRILLDEAVRCRVRSDYSMGSESSGGLDSSTVTALAGRLMPNAGEDLHTFGFATCELEPECILSVSQTTPMKMTHLDTRSYLTSAARVAAVDKVFRHSNGVPEEHINATFHWPFYKEASQWGIRTMLSGFGGDEFSTNNGTLALRDLWLQKRYRLWLSRQYASENFLKTPIRIMRWLRDVYLRERSTPLSRVLVSAGEDKLNYLPLTDIVCARYSIRKKIMFWHRYELGWPSINTFVLGNRWSPMMTARLENCSLMAASQGIEYRWPLLDVRLINFWLAAPPELKIGSGHVTRYLHRRAVADVVPPMIVEKSKYMGEPVTKVGVGMDLPTPELPGYDRLHPELQELVAPDRLNKLANFSIEKLSTDTRVNLSIILINSLNDWLNTRAGAVSTID